MANLREAIVVSNARRGSVSIDWPDDNKKPTQIELGLRGKLSPEAAEVLKIGWVYADGSAPHEFKDIGFEFKFVHIELHMTSKERTFSIFPELVSGFKVYKMGDVNLGIRMTFSLTGEYQGLLAFMEEIRNNEFEFELRPRQTELFDEAGKRVDMTGDASPAEPSANPVAAADAVAEIEELNRIAGLETATLLDGSLPWDPPQAPPLETQEQSDQLKAEIAEQMAKPTEPEPARYVAPRRRRRDAAKE